MADRNSITVEFLEGVGRRCAHEGRDASATLTHALELVEGLPAAQRRDLDVEAVVAAVLAGWDRARRTPAPTPARVRRWSVPVAAAAAIGAIVASAAALVTGLGESSPAPQPEVAGVTATSEASPAQASPDLVVPSTAAAEPDPDREAATITEPLTGDEPPSVPSPTVAAGNGPQEVTVVVIALDRDVALERLPDEVTPTRVFSDHALPGEFPRDLPVFVVAEGRIPTGVCVLLADRDDVTLLGDTTGCLTL